MKYKWDVRAISDYYYEQDTGKIVGKILRLNFSDDIYHAEVHGDSLGEYIGLVQARKAVEKQIAKNEKDDAAYLKKEIKVTNNPWGLTDE